MASNPEIADNELGITARACADHYCSSRDSLDLWMAVEWDCHKDEAAGGDGQGPESSTAVEEIAQAPSRRRQLSASTGTSTSLLVILDDIAALTVTRILTAVVSSILSVVGLLVGFRVGRLWTAQAKAKESVGNGASRSFSSDSSRKKVDRRSTASRPTTRYGSLETEDVTDESERELFFSNRSSERLREIFSSQVAATNGNIPPLPLS